MKTLIESTLEIPVFEGSDSIIYPAATLECTDHPAGLIGDGKAVIRETEAVINLWYETKAPRDSGYKLLIAAIEAAGGATVPDIFNSYDTTAKKYRSVISFNFITREET